MKWKISGDEVATYRFPVMPGIDYTKLKMKLDYHAMHRTTYMVQHSTKDL